MPNQNSGKKIKPEIFDQLSCSNKNSFWGAMCAEVLARLGLREAVITPGSRSTPLTFAFSRHRNIQSTALLDERSASFFALGLAQEKHRPIVLICTSGTAAANFYPAIIEASESRIPLLIMTADRPPELRHCHSGQTIDQQKLYGRYPNFELELSLPSVKSARLKYLRQTLVHAWERCRYPVAGPVHLNFPFRDPLAPSDDKDDQTLMQGLDLLSLIDNVEPLIEVRESRSPVEAIKLVKNLKSADRGLIIVGPNQPQNAECFASSVGQIATELGWPTLTDGLSPLRGFSNLNPYLISHYHFILSHPDLLTRLRPKAVLSIGPLPASKILRAWLEQIPAKTWVLSEALDNVDGLHREATPLRMSVETLRAIIGKKRTAPTAYCQEWLKVEKRVTGILNKEMRNCHFLFEGKTAWVLSKSLSKRTPLFIANSMPIRDVEIFWSANNRQIRPYFNRGANGIDGTLSTALGIAQANKKAVLFTGDLALLHDTNGFLIHSCFKGHLTIILINNNGGGIFENLPIAKFNPQFEDYFATPQNVSFKKIAAAYSLEYSRVKNLDELRKMVSVLPSSGIRILEIETNRKKDTRFLKELSHSIANQLKN